MSVLRNIIFLFLAIPAFLAGVAFNALPARAQAAADAAAAPGGVLAPDGGLVWWHFEGQRRTRDGGVEASFALRGTEGLPVDGLEFFYTADPIRYGPAAEHAVEPENRRKAYRKTAAPGAVHLVIYSGRYVQLELWAVAQAGGKRFVAQTALNLYGESGREAAGFEQLPGLPPLPGFNLNWKRGFYAAQTGEPVSFTMRDGTPGPVRVFLDGEPVAVLRPEEGVYDYVFPRGRRLAGRALLDHRDLLFVSEVSGGAAADGEGGGAARFTCCLPLYRSMRDNLHFPLGLGILGAAFALGLGAVLWRGRRFAWR